MSIILTMFLLGSLLGFVGAGGAGFIIAVLILLFHVPIHTALGTSLAAMTFTTISGAVSHYREGNTDVKVGTIVGIFGAGGAFIGSKIAAAIPTDSLHWFTAVMLFLSAVLLVIRLFLVKNTKETDTKETELRSVPFLIKAVSAGTICGLLSGSFGIGSTPFIQIGLLMLLGLSLRKSIGTTMLVIIPIAVGGGIGYHSEGYLDYMLLVQILIGTMSGAYIGAKFTNFAPKLLLKFAMIATPALAAIIMFFV
ncbi:sulfite exporter TauE/SafE family protein [Bacillus taeanensis]|uniref:Probable membrane transporter protein n=1 Tax=Bacillus taeanensis TaxID=273032 RepID=A0A366Y412_9BACI|nr:sulfite exporter TauE/SafE family protein [Bacillus taeanensis]RBW71153.1 sulfite exporter TauE/SafE family protein [Bacillus taeanensis]